MKQNDTTGRQIRARLKNATRADLARLRRIYPNDAAMLAEIARAERKLPPLQLIDRWPGDRYPGDY